MPLSLADTLAVNYDPARRSLTQDVLNGEPYAMTIAGYRAADHVMLLIVPPGLMISDEIEAANIAITETARSFAVDRMVISLDTRRTYTDGRPEHPAMLFVAINRADDVLATEIPYRVVEVDGLPADVVFSDPVDADPVDNSPLVTIARTAMKGAVAPGRILPDELRAVAAEEPTMIGAWEDALDCASALHLMTHGLVPFLTFKRDTDRGVQRAARLMSQRAYTPALCIAEMGDPS